MKIGIEELDDLLKLEKGKLVVLAGRPSMGKSDFTLDIVKSILKENKSVLMFNMESTKEMILKKLFNNESKLNMENLVINDKGGITIDEIIEICRETKKQNNLELIIIDYLQLIGVVKSLDTRKEEIDVIVKKTKELTKEMNIPVILVSELSRSLEIRKDKRPILDDFKDSVSVIEFADVIVFMYRESYYNKRKDDNCMTELIIAKNKDGKTGAYKVYLN